MKMDRDAQAILNRYAQFNAPPIESLSPENARNNPTLKNAVEEMMGENPASRPIPPSVGKITHELIPGPAGDILARVYTPEGEGPFPVLVYFHGGGWVIANLEVYEPSCRALCNKAHAIVVSVAYRQAPEHKYPAAAEDAYAATQWVMQNARMLNGDPERVVVGGESAGGNLATVACLKARDEGGLMPIGQLLIYPVTDARRNMPSYKENADAKPLNAPMMAWFWKHYLETEDQGLEAYASPLLSEDLSKLPPAVIFTADIDPLRDEGEAYAARLQEFGVPVKAKRFEGVMHEFFGLAGAVAKATQAVDEASLELNRLYNLRLVEAVK